MTGGIQGDEEVEWVGFGRSSASCRLGAYVMNTYVPLQNNTGTPG